MLQLEVYTPHGCNNYLLKPVLLYIDACRICFKYFWVLYDVKNSLAKYNQTNVIITEYFSTVFMQCSSEKPILW